MAEPPGMKYVATHDIEINGVCAKRAGDLVHYSAVEGDGAWLVLGVDVEPREGTVPNRPARNAPTGAWAAWVKALGADEVWADGQSRADLIAWAEQREGTDAGTADHA